MNQFKKLFGSMSTQQMVGILVVLAIVGGGLYSFVHWNHEQGFKPLFTGMAPEDASTIVAKLKETGVEYRISDNGTSVSVPEAKVNELRLEMAGAGLPKTGRIGFELFDRNNLGITDFTEKVNYRRALEGELERSIKALSVVEQARVHITFPKDSVFLDSRENAKASILISTRAGSRLSAQNVVAVSNLVASAVEGLSPDFVSVLDMQGNLLNRPRRHADDGSEPSEAALDYKHQIEKDLVSKVQSTLDPLLGENRFRVGVTADVDFTSSEQSEEVLDPTKSVMVTTQKSEDLLGSAAGAGVPGTPSNVPRAVPRAVGSGTNSSRKNESAAFETSKTIRHTKVPQGSIKRLSASILLDQEVKWEGKGKSLKRTIIPPTPEKIKAINDVIAGVLGLQTERGDKLVIQSLAFEQTLNDTAPDDGSKLPEKPKDQLKQLLKDPKVLGGAGAVVLLILGLVFMLLKKGKPAPALPVALPQPTSAKSIEAAEPVPEPKVVSALESLQLPPMTKRLEGLRDHIKESVRKEPELAAEVLRGWLGDGSR